MKKNIYLINRTDTWGYDEYDSWMVIAKNEEDAKLISPSPYDTGNYKDCCTVKLIGKCTNNLYNNGDVVISSFNAG